MLGKIGRLLGLGASASASRVSASSALAEASSALSNYSREALERMVVAPQAKDALLKRCDHLPKSNVLRMKTQKVPFTQITTKTYQRYADRLIRVMTVNELVSASAPQVGLSIRMLAIDGVTISNAIASSEADLMPPDVPMVAFNPTIEKTGKRKSVVLEQCVSVPGYAGAVERYDTIVVRYFSRGGIEYVERLEGPFAHAFQHELDHLDGLLWTDDVKDKEIFRIDENWSLANIVTVFGRESGAPSKRKRRNSRK